MDGDPRIARVELGIVDEGILGGHRWRYRLTRGLAEEEHEMDWMSRPLGRFECSLRGALQVMDRISEGGAVRIEAPECPLVLGMTHWIHRWRRNGWRNRHGDPVRHRDLWETLWAMAAERHVEWVAATKPPAQVWPRDGMFR